MTTNNPQPPVVAEAPERIYIQPRAATTLDEQLRDGGIWHYEGSPDCVEYVRTLTPDSITEKATRATRRIINALPYEIA